MVYLDFNASTPLDESVRDAMVEIDKWAVNPGSSQHLSGVATGKILENARLGISQALNVNEQTIMFTSGASEGIAIAILGAIAWMDPDKRGLIVSATEHKAVLQAAKNACDLFGSKIFVVPVSGDGEIDIEVLEVALRSGEYGLVAMMSANNETGVINDTGKIANIVHRYDALYLCDLTQSLGKQDVTEVFEYCDLGVFSGHKFYGPKGSGVLYIQRHVQKRIAPIFSGGGQERGLRGGTQHASNAHGLFMSMSKALQEMPTNLSHFEMLTSHFRSQLILSGVNFIEIGERAARLPNTLNVRFVGFDADELLANIPEVEVSTGSACNSAVQEPSHVLLAHGLSVSEANECVRFSFGASTALHEIDFAARSIQFALGRLRDIKMVG